MSSDEIEEPGTGKAGRRKRKNGGGGSYLVSGGARGRSTILDVAIHKRIVDAVSVGIDQQTAAAAAGIQPETLTQWKRKGLAERAMGRRTRRTLLVDDLERAEARARAHAVVDAVAVRRRDPRAALQYLERRYPNEWGRQIQDVRHSGVVVNAAVEVDLADLLDLSTLDDQQLAALETRLRIEERNAEATAERVVVDVPAEGEEEG